MKKFWVRFITVAALGCLLSVWTLPALAYYPPLEAKAKKKRTEVTFSVNDPEIGFTFDVYYGVYDKVEKNGVLAMIQGIYEDPVNVRVTYVTYDPFRKKFMTNISDQQETYSDISQLKVVDGVVAYIGMDSEGNKAFIYATYDPKEGVWRQMKWLPYHHDVPKFVIKDLLVFITDGVVVYGNTSTYTPLNQTDVWVYADIYNPIQGNWQTGLSGIPFLLTNYGKWVDIKGFAIKNATISYDLVAGFPGVKPVAEHATWGYDYSTNHWHKNAGPTNPLAYFVALPSSGSDPLRVWFTDMSIGAYNVNWDFGDGEKDNKRSTYHKYTSNGTYTATQELGIPLPQREQLPSPFQIYYSEEIHVGP
jgi:hypothetical protein